MSHVTPQIRNFASRLIAHETDRNNSPSTPADFAVDKKLRPHLATLMGNGGFRALLSRSLALGSLEIAWLSAVHVQADGSLEGLEELYGEVEANEFLEGRVVLLAQMLGLLVVFIGEDLTLRLVREVWPKVPFNELSSELNSGNRGKHENKK